jgi:hypothetical protein
MPQAWSTGGRRPPQPVDLGTQRRGILFRRIPHRGLGASSLAEAAPDPPYVRQLHRSRALSRSW